jgi:hypothetical protein
MLPRDKIKATPIAEHCNLHMCTLAKNKQTNKWFHSKSESLRDLGVPPIGSYVECAKVVSYQIDKFVKFI